ncbi:MAG: biotin/lipoyl-containing protein, partial [Planctomycetota bacterium]
MPVISIRIPQLGEGLQEALLVELLKQPGDRVKRDEPIYVMETDKATTDVESPYEGTIVEWTVKTGTVLALGAEIGRIEVAEGVREVPVGHGPADSHAAPTP